MSPQAEKVSGHKRAPLKSNSVGPCQLHTFGTMGGVVEQKKQQLSNDGFKMCEHLIFQQESVNIIFILFSIQTAHQIFLHNHKSLSLLSVSLSAKQRHNDVTS